MHCLPFNHNAFLQYSLDRGVLRAQSPVSGSHLIATSRQDGSRMRDPISGVILGLYSGHAHPATLPPEKHSFRHSRKLWERKDIELMISQLRRVKDINAFTNEKYACSSGHTS